MNEVAQAAHALSVLSLIWQYSMHGTASVLIKQKRERMCPCDSLFAITFTCVED